jgi:hypothetical protein
LPRQCPRAYGMAGWIGGGTCMHEAPLCNQVTKRSLLPRQPPQAPKEKHLFTRLPQAPSIQKHSSFMACFDKRSFSLMLVLSCPASLHVFPVKPRNDAEPFVYAAYPQRQGKRRSEPARASLALLASAHMPTKPRESQGEEKQDKEGWPASHYNVLLIAGRRRGDQLDTTIYL